MWTAALTSMNDDWCDGGGADAENRTQMRKSLQTLCL
jgi:hypothetical protein